MLRLSLDAKAVVLLGELSRGGKARVTVKALDHDYRPDKKAIPFGIYLPDHGRLFLYFTTSVITSDFIVDCLDDCWQTIRSDYPQVKTLVLHQDNGPECHSRRTQFMKRITEFATSCQRTIQLAYYPPYHSKYNPIERVWGGLEQHWNGSLLDSVPTVIKFAQTMKWRGQHPTVKLCQKEYQTGVRLSPKVMQSLEERWERMPKLEKWFVTIQPT